MFIGEFNKTKSRAASEINLKTRYLRVTNGVLCRMEASIMLTLIISLLFSAASVYACMVNQVGQGLTITAGIVTFLLMMILLGRVMGKRMAHVQTELQNTMLEGQKRINRDIQHFQSKPGGNPKAMQMQIEQKQKRMIQQALELTQNFEPYKKWNLLMGRQIATMQLQFNYQLKEFEKVDEILARKGLFAKPMLSEPLGVAMKMARQYEKGDIKGVEKTFKKQVKWFRGERASLLYGVMSWVYVKKGEFDQARQLLVKGKDSTGNEVFIRNWEMLSNGKEKKFSNKGLGEEWYALYLENPPMPKQQRMRGNAKAQSRF